MKTFLEWIFPVKPPGLIHYEAVVMLCKTCHVMSMYASLKISYYLTHDDDPDPD